MTLRLLAALLLAGLATPAAAAVVVTATSPVATETPVSFEAEDAAGNCGTGWVYEEWWVEDADGNASPIEWNLIGDEADFPCNSARQISYTFPAAGEYTVHYGYTAGSGFWRALACALGACALEEVGTLDVDVRCSGHIGGGTLNEAYRGGGQRFIEVKLLDGSIASSVYDDWYVVACSGSGNQRRCTGSATTTTIANADVSNYPWFVWDENTFTDQQVFSMNQGMDVLLFDGSGGYVDYLSVSGYTYQQPTPSCPFIYPTTATANNNGGDIYRLPDGTGPWEFLQNGVPTKGAINITDSGNLATLSITAATANASTCQPLAVTVTAYDGGGNIYPDYTGTIALTTSSGHGNWSLAATANGGLSPAPDDDDDGAASYYFPLDASDQGQVQLYLSNAHADDLTITVADSFDPSITASTAAIGFRDNAFVVEEAAPLPALGANVAVAGRPHPYTATLWQRDRDDPSIDCAIATGYTGTKNLRAWYSADADHPGGALVPAIGAAPLPAAEPVAENLTLDFIDGVSAFSLATSDVGKYSLALADRVSGFALDSADNPQPILGGSPVVTVQPFALGFTDMQQLAAPNRANPGATADQGTAVSGFVAAGEAFRATLGAYLWQSADDLDDDGLADAGADVTDNGLAPAFDWPATLAAAAPFTPASGVLGTLSATDPAAGDFAGGQATIADLRYAEVGSLTLSATASNYLNTAGVNPGGASDVIGRFYPHRFALNGPDYAAACGSFSYMGQAGMRIAYELQALSASGTTTTNYDSDRGYAVGAVEHVAEDGNDGIDLSARISGADPATKWIEGVFSVDLYDAVFARAGGGPDGPYGQLAVGVTVANEDGTLIAGADMNPATATDCTADASCTALTLGTAAARFGRASVENAFGSEYLDLAVPLRAGFYAGEALGFLPNPDDACSTPLSVALADADPGDGLDYSAGDTCVQDNGSPGTSGAGCPDIAPVAQQFTDPPLAGDFNLWLRAPGADKSGAVLVDAVVPAWLEYDWDGDGIHDNPPPTARAVFGSYRGDDRIIYWRERFE